MSRTVALSCHMPFGACDILDILLLTSRLFVSFCPARVGLASVTDLQRQEVRAPEIP
jgi:hypothetical protein